MPADPLELTEERRQVAHVAERGHRVVSGPQRAGAELVDPRGVHERGVEVADLAVVLVLGGSAGRAARREVLDDLAHLLLGGVGQLHERAPAGPVGGDLHGLQPAAVDVAEQVVLRPDVGVHALAGVVEDAHAGTLIGRVNVGAGSGPFSAIAPVDPVQARCELPFRRNCAGWVDHIGRNASPSRTGTTSLGVELRGDPDVIAEADRVELAAAGGRPEVVVEGGLGGREGGRRLLAPPGSGRARRGRPAPPARIRRPRGPRPQAAASRRASARRRRPRRAASRRRAAAPATGPTAARLRRQAPTTVQPGVGEGEADRGAVGRGQHQPLQPRRRQHAGGRAG